jgi:putative restriction endonuclease
MVYKIKTRIMDNYKDKRRGWVRSELILAFNLYCRLPFGKNNPKNPEVVALAHVLNRTPSAVSWKLANFASLDPALSRKGAKNSGKLDKEIFDEFSNDWEGMVFESELIRIDSMELGRRELILNLESFEGKERKASVRARVNQQFFRKMVLASYNNKCAITGMGIDDLLVASHIVPWSVDHSNQLNPQNGISLNRLHDYAFDKGLITIDIDYKVRLSQHLLSIEKDEANLKFFKVYEGEKIILPSKFVPNQTFLEYHRENIFLK